MSELSIEQFIAFLSKDKCIHCEKKPKWFASPTSPAYCDEHFPYKDLDKEKECAQTANP